MSKEDRFLAAADMGAVNIVKEYLDNGVDVHYRCEHALLCAAYNGHYEVVALLLCYGADPLVDGQLALEFAIEKNDVPMINLLREWIETREI